MCGSGMDTRPENVYIYVSFSIKTFCINWQNLNKVYRLDKEVNGRSFPDYDKRTVVM